MINTGGYQVNVLPQYAPVDPGLAAFNPSEALHGMMTAYQAAGTLDQIKAFKQHAAEVAATEGIRTKLLQTQADQQVLALKHAQDIEDAKRAAELATLEHERAMAPEQTKAGTAQAEATVKTAPAIANTVVGANEAAQADQAFQASQRPTLQAAQSIANSDLPSLALQQSLANVKKAQAEVSTANLAAEKAKEDWLAGATGKDKAEAASTAANLAKARLDDAQAKYYSTRNTTAAEIASKRAEAVDTHSKAYNALSLDYSRAINSLKELVTEPAINPDDPSDQRFTVSQLVQAAQIPKESALKRFFGLGEKEPIPEFVLDRIRAIKEKRADVDARAAQLSAISRKIGDAILGGEVGPAAPAQAAQPSSPAITIPTVWRNPATGKIELKPTS